MGNFVYGAILEQYHLEELKSNLKYSFTTDTRYYKIFKVCLLQEILLNFEII